MINCSFFRFLKLFMLSKAHFFLSFYSSYLSYLLQRKKMHVFVKRFLFICYVLYTWKKIITHIRFIYNQIINNQKEVSKISPNKIMYYVQNIDIFNWKINSQHNRLYVQISGVFLIFVMLSISFIFLSIKTIKKIINIPFDDN